MIETPRDPHFSTNVKRLLDFRRLLQESEIEAPQLEAQTYEYAIALYYDTVGVNERHNTDCLEYAAFLFFEARKQDYSLFPKRERPRPWTTHHYQNRPRER